MQEYKTLLDLVRFIAGATKVLENIVGTISIRVPGGTRINLNLMEWHVLDCLARHEKQASQKEKPSELLQSALVSAAETPRSSALSTLLSNLEFGKNLIQRHQRGFGK